MAGFADLGAALAGNDSGNALSYAKGLQYGATTADALAQARARASRNTARENLQNSLTALVPDENERRAYVALIQSEVDPGQLASAQLKNQERGFRSEVADPNVDEDIAQRRLLALANGPQETFKPVGEGQFQNVLHPSQGVTTSGLGNALIDQRTQAARLDEEKRLHPERFAASGSPFLVTPGGVFTKTPPPKPGAAPSLTPTIGPDGKPINYAAAVGDVAGARTGATVNAKNTATNQASLPDALADIDKMTKNIDDLTKAPGFSSIYGHLAGTETGRTISKMFSQDSANADAMRNTLSAESFGIAIQKMRGLGQLSNAEGTKVTDAFTRATNATISPAEAQKAWADVKAYLSLARSRAIRKAQGDNSAQPAGAEAPGGAPGAPADFSALWQ